MQTQVVQQRQSALGIQRAEVPQDGVDGFEGLAAMRPGAQGDCQGGDGDEQFSYERLQLALSAGKSPSGRRHKDKRHERCHTRRCGCGVKRVGKTVRYLHRKKLGG